MKIIDVCVRKKIGAYTFNFLCMPTQTKIKCGRCLRGNIKPQKGFKCAVCKATVVSVRRKYES